MLKYNKFPTNSAFLLKSSLAKRVMCSVEWLECSFFTLSPLSFTTSLASLAQRLATLIAGALPPEPPGLLRSFHFLVLRSTPFGSGEDSPRNTVGLGGPSKLGSRPPTPSGARRRLL